MIAWVAARNDAAELRPGPRLPVPVRHDDLRPGPDRGPDRPGPDDQRADHALEPGGQPVIRGNLHRGAGRGIARLPAAGLPPVDRRRVPGVPEDRRRQSRRRRLGRHARRGARPRCSRRRAAAARGPRRPVRRRRPSPASARTRPPRRGPGAGRCRPATSPGLVDYANTHFELAQAALRNGDFATYGEEMDKVEVALEQLATLLGTPVPSIAPSPAASPTPGASPSP